MPLGLNARLEVRDVFWGLSDKRMGDKRMNSITPPSLSHSARQTSRSPFACPHFLKPAASFLKSKRSLRRLRRCMMIEVRVAFLLCSRGPSVRLIDCSTALLAEGQASSCSTDRLSTALPDNRQAAGCAIHFRRRFALSWTVTITRSHPIRPHFSAIPDSPTGRGRQIAGRGLARQSRTVE